MAELKQSIDERVLHDEDALIMLIDEARHQGYREAYIEFSQKYASEIGFSKEEYQIYLEAKLNYEEEPSISNMNRLISVTKDIIQ